MFQYIFALASDFPESDIRMRLFRALVIQPYPKAFLPLRELQFLQSAILFSIGNFIHE